MWNNKHRESFISRNITACSMGVSSRSHNKRSCDKKMKIKINMVAQEGGSCIAVEEWRSEPHQFQIIRIII